MRPVELDVLGRGPAELDDGAGPAHDLLGRRACHGHRIALELRELAPVVHEGAEATGDRVPRRLVPGDDEQHEVGHQLERRDRLSVHARGRERARDVVARLLRPSLHERREVVEHLLDGSLERFHGGRAVRALAELRVGRCEISFVQRKSVRQSSRGTPRRSAMTASGTIAENSGTKSISSRSRSSCRSSATTASVVGRSRSSARGVKRRETRPR